VTPTSEYHDPRRPGTKNPRFPAHSSASRPS
jgi:hypothetical protein